ncbi:hypothetical protein AVEN_139902-1 [Araneus ventricosus]|uniref:Uncharacterized protein n=1 Tax=Araneus ventricosus TaxID=182803 RepID=A0A4Y2JCF5_ARAVE|nr:hypothetical protein AVEN_139902-1 [Araneus ventricosus]
MVDARSAFDFFVPLWSALHVIRSALLCPYDWCRTSYVRLYCAPMVDVARHTFDFFVPLWSASHVIRSGLLCLYGRRRTSYVRLFCAHMGGVA